MRLTIALLLGLLALPSFAFSALAQEWVSIPNGDEKPLQGMLYLPEGAGPHPAIIALHGCGGLRTPSGRIGERHADWARRLAVQGFAVLFPDSFGSRGLGSQCLVKDRTVRPSRERVSDVYAAKAWLQEQRFADSTRISLLGWSNGASSLLWAIAGERKARDGKPDFKSAVAFYPGCRLVAQAAERRDWRARMPLLILMGDADTWTPVQPCQQLVDMTLASGQAASITIYKGALHEFDHPSRALTKRTGLAFTGDDSGEAMVGTDPVARADALVRVPQFLRQ
jgi:dienelactone hydrolase